jgi:hypothetical protein
MTWAATKTKQPPGGGIPEWPEPMSQPRLLALIPPPETIKGDIYHEGMQTINRF